jgi:hypothetical protein
LAREREVELEFLARVLALERGPRAALEKILYAAVEDPAERALRNVARKLLESLMAGGPAEAIASAHAHRCRIPLFR